MERILKGWYRSAEDRQPKPCHESMVKQIKERKQLYAKVPPPGDPIPSIVEVMKSVARSTVAKAEEE